MPELEQRAKYSFTTEQYGAWVSRCLSLLLETLLAHPPSGAVTPDRLDVADVAGLRAEVDGGGLAVGGVAGDACVVAEVALGGGVADEH